MVFGGIDEERIVLNESGMWSGSPQDADRPDAAAALPEIRRLLLAGENVAAEALVNAHFTCAGQGSGHGSGADVPYGCYQTLGALSLSVVHAGTGDPEGYRRSLDLGDATARIAYRLGGVGYTREPFASAPDEVLVFRFRADRPGQVGFDARLGRSERAGATPWGSDGLMLAGQLNDGRESGRGVRFSARLRALTRGGTTRVEDGVLRVRGADEAVLLVAAATDIRTFAGRGIADAQGAAAADLESAAGRSWEALRRDHVADYRHLFDRVRLRLGPPGGYPGGALPTPERLRAFHAGTPDPDLAALYFDFGRYLLISSSRPGGLPANLQGIWAEEIQTP
jgi:alpha-L-fucosidase 2